MPARTSGLVDEGGGDVPVKRFKVGEDVVRGGVYSLLYVVHPACCRCYSMKVERVEGDMVRQ